ncbi:MAG: hypothetical protein HYS86_03505 [Candidatus Chisholmbacteria bacterium]|nr:hypothetical protein [Candidatus Chisholmbacteria bacterium]
MTTAQEEQSVRSASEPLEKSYRDLEVLLKWKSQARPFKKRDREYYTTIGAIVFLVAVVLIFLKQWLLIAVLVALAFLSYVLAAVPPGEVEHFLTNKGVVTGGKMYPWKDLKQFWFGKKWGERYVEVVTKSGFPGRLVLLLGEQDEGTVEKLLGKWLWKEKPAEGSVDRMARWLSKKVPLEA